MRKEIEIPVYSEGASQGITFRHREFSYAIPSYSFTDEYTQTLWAKTFAKRARKLIGKNAIENTILDVFRYRGSQQYNDRIHQRRLAKQLGRCDPLERDPFLDRIKNQTLIALKEFVPESRRNNTDYAALSFSETNRYRAVNFTAFRKYKTLEIRLHSGTVDYTKIIAWIRLCELLFVINTKPKSGAEGVAALSQLPLTEYERSYWLKRHQQLNPGHYNSSTPSTETE